jgi:hypothetical protein
VILISIIYAIYISIGNDFKEYLRDRNEFYNLLKTMLKYVYIKKELFILTLHEDINNEFQVKRCLILKNMSDNSINDFFIPWFYDLYEKGKEEEYKPKIKSLKLIHYEKICKHTESYEEDKDADLINDFIQPDGIMNVAGKFPEARGWIKIPIRLDPLKTINITLTMNQKYIYREMYTKKGEYAGVLVTSPTGELQIEVNAPPGKKITPVNDYGESIKIENKTLNIIDFKEGCNVDPPIFNNDKAIWIIKHPKVGHYYMLRFKIIPP